MSAPRAMTAASHEKPRRAFPCAKDGAKCLAMQKPRSPQGLGPTWPQSPVSRDAWYGANPLWFPSPFPKLLDVNNMTGLFNLQMACDSTLPTPTHGSS